MKEFCTGFVVSSGSPIGVYNKNSNFTCIVRVKFEKDLLIRWNDFPHLCGKFWVDCMGFNVCQYDRVKILCDEVPKELLERHNKIRWSFSDYHKIVWVY